MRWVGPGGEPVVDATESFAVATSSVDAFALAGDLASLIDEMAIEGVDWAALDRLDMGAYDPFWRLTTTFLRIAVEQWPRILADHGLVDPAARQIALVDAQARRLAEGGTAGPVVALGSTGSNKATARLLAAIARAPGAPWCCPGSISTSTPPPSRWPPGARRRGRSRATAIRSRRWRGCSAC